MERRVIDVIDQPMSDSVVSARDWRRLFVHLSLAGMDIALTFSAFALAHWLRYDIQFGRDIYDPQSYQQLKAFYPHIAAFTAILSITLHLRGLYRLRRTATWYDDAAIIFNGVTIAIALVIIGMFSLRRDIWSRLIMVFVWVLTCAILIASRIILRRVLRWGWKNGRWLERTLVVGNRGLAKMVMTELGYSHLHGASLVGYIDGPPDDRHDLSKPDERFRWLGHFEDLATILEHRHIDHVIVALPFWAHDTLPAVVQTCRRYDVEFRVAPDLYELSFDRVNIQRLSNIPLLKLKKNVIQGWNFVLKRMVDIFVMSVTAPIWGTIWGLAALAIKLSAPTSSVMFSQERVGRHGKRFLVYKLRTMVPNAEALKEQLRQHNEAEGALFKMKNDPRVTRLGRIFRKLSIDELPQLYNVLKGDMSLVGPRPQVPDEVEQYEAWHYRRLEVPPGLTGLWQASGRSNTSFDDMVRLDIYYTEHWSLWLDVRIMLMTIPAVLFGRGAY